MPFTAAVSTSGEQEKEIFLEESIVSSPQSGYSSQMFDGMFFSFSYIFYCCHYYKSGMTIGYILCMEWKEHGNEKSQSSMCVIRYNVSCRSMQSSDSIDQHYSRTVFRNI